MSDVLSTLCSGPQTNVLSDQQWAWQTLSPEVKLQGQIDLPSCPFNRDHTDCPRKNGILEQCWIKMDQCRRRWATLNQHCFNVSYFCRVCREWRALENKEKWYNVVLMLGQCRKRRPNIKNTMWQNWCNGRILTGVYQYWYKCRRNAKCCFNVRPAYYTLVQH